MSPPHQSSQEALCAAILAEARRQSEQLLEEARQEAEARLARTRELAEQVREQRLEAARAAAARQSAQILAAVPLEAGRLRLAAVESQLQSIYEEARHGLEAIRAGSEETNGAQVRETLIALAVEAISRMAGDAFVVKLSPADYGALGPAMELEIAGRLGNERQLALTISEDPDLTGAGIIIEDREGRQVWDNRLAVRLERMWPELRRQMALATALVDEESAPAEAST